MKRRDLFKHAARFALGVAGAKPVTELLAKELFDAEETATRALEGEWKRDYLEPCLPDAHAREVWLTAWELAREIELDRIWGENRPR